MSENFDYDVVQSGLRMLEAQHLRAQAEYNEATAYGNTDAALAAAKEMAENTAEGRRLVNLYNDSIPKPLVEVEETAEQKIAKLEEEKENYRKAYLKETEKNKADPASETDDERMRRIALEVQAETRIGEIDKEQADITAKALKENKELKATLAGQIKAPPATMGSHSETISVTDTSITPEQMAFFKSKNWTDADIARYKENLRKRPG